MISGPRFPELRHNCEMEIVPQPHGGALHMTQKGDRLNPYGRPKKLVSTVLTQLREAGYERVGPASVNEAIEQLIGASDSILRSIQKDKEQPMCMRIIAEAILSKKGRFNAIQALMDRAHGKAKQQVELSGEGGIPIPTVTVVVQAPKLDAGG